MGQAGEFIATCCIESSFLQRQFAHVRDMQITICLHFGPTGLKKDLDQGTYNTKVLFSKIKTNNLFTGGLD